jgi:hypothetical protein
MGAPQNAANVRLPRWEILQRRQTYVCGNGNSAKRGKRTFAALGDSAETIKRARKGFVEHTERAEMLTRLSQLECSLLAVRRISGGFRP